MVSERLQRHIERLLDEADQAIVQRQWDVVRQRAQDILAMDPENRDALAFLATTERVPATAPASTKESPTSPQPTSAQTPAQPTSFADGRYQVKRFPGEGGKKKVYLAHDTTLDREVAFATPELKIVNDGPRLGWGVTAPPIKAVLICGKPARESRQYP